MTVILPNFFEPRWWIPFLPVILLGALGPTLLEARGARALWLVAAGIWLAVAVARSLIYPPGETFWLGYLAIWLALVVGVVFLLARLKGPVAVRTLVALLVAIVLPPVMIYAILYFAMTCAPPSATGSGWLSTVLRCIGAR